MLSFNEALSSNKDIEESEAIKQLATDLKTSHLELEGRKKELIQMNSRLTESKDSEKDLLQKNKDLRSQVRNKENSLEDNETLKKELIQKIQVLDTKVDLLEQEKENQNTCSSTD